MGEATALSSTSIPAPERKEPGVCLREESCSDVRWERGSTTSSLRLYGTCHKKLYEIRGLSASEICSFFRGIAEDIRRVVKGCPRNCERVSAEPSKGVRGIVLYSKNSRREVGLVVVERVESS